MENKKIRLPAEIEISRDTGEIVDVWYGEAREEEFQRIIAALAGKKGEQNEKIYL